VDKAIWDKCAAFHGHTCPGLALGVRLCEYVRERLGWGFSPDEELVCIAETDACPVDAVQVLLGCTFGKGNLLYTPTGKSAYTFYSRATGKGVPGVALRKGQNMNPGERNAVDPGGTRWRPSSPPLAPKSPCRKSPALPHLHLRGLRGDHAEHMARLQEGKVVCLHCFPPL
jgi:formylmethanofuran dehydrogenase subunit E